jgi:hypothetical protein
VAIAKPAEYLTSSGGGEGQGYYAAPALLLALIHRIAWNRNSRKFTCRIVHITPS